MKFTALILAAVSLCAMPSDRNSGSVECEYRAEPKMSESCRGVDKLGFPCRGKGYFDGYGIGGKTYKCGSCGARWIEKN